MAGILFLDNYDTTALGLVVESVTGLSDVPAVALRTRDRYGWAGLIETSATPKIAPRTIKVAGTMVAATTALLETNLDALKLRCVNAVLVRVMNNATRQWTAKLTDFTITPLPGPQFLNWAVGVTLTFTAVDPYGYDTSDTTVTSITNSDKACAVGTAPSRPVLRCTGAATNPLWTYKSQAGATITTLQLTITIAGGDWVEVDCYNMTIRKSVSSVITDALSTLTTGDFIRLDPKDATGGSPTLRCSVGTGLATYRKAWI